MSSATVGTDLVRAWLSGRSIARGVPQPVADRGGFRVDSGTDTEVARWVFAQVEPGLVELSRTITEQRHFLKLCGEAGALRSALPSRWQIQPPNFFMQASGAWAEAALPDGYSLDVGRTDRVVTVRVYARDGSLAASGYGGEGDAAFVYDRIVTAPDHQRRGLGRVVMSALRRSRLDTTLPELLVATEEGRAMYARLGWRTLSPYSTAVIPPTSA